MKITMPPGFQYPDLKIKPISIGTESHPLNGFQFSTEAVRRIADYNGLDVEDLKSGQLVPIIDALYREYRASNPGYCDEVGEYLSAFVEAARNRTHFVLHEGRA